MTLNEYQEKAMTTCTPSSENDVYMLNGLTAEVGEVNDKVAKWVRKGLARIDSNHLVFNTSEIEVRDAYVVELVKEIGDCLWFLAGLSREFGWNLEEVAQMNLDKLQSRQQRGVIVGEGDNR